MNQSSANFFGYDIFHKDKVTLTHEADPNNRFDSDSTITEWEIADNVVKSDSCFADIVTTMKLEKNKEYYLLAYTGSAGDSFSSNTACNLFFIDIFSTLAKAEKVIEAMKHPVRQPVFSYQDENGFSRSLDCTWYDYFQPVEDFILKRISLL